ncbi:MAG: amidohydrolase [Dehalococcoidia bacterium]
MSLAATAASEGSALVFFNGRVHTVDTGDRVAEAIAVRGERIVAVGSNAEVRPLAPARRGIDLRGRTIVPGLIDAHTHIGFYGAGKLGIDCKAAGFCSIVQIQDAVRERAARLPPGTWIRGQGYNHMDLQERRHPNRFDLDAAAPGHPVVINRTCGHIVAANSRALALAGIDDTTSDPPGGRFERDGRRNLGVAIDAAAGPLMAVSALGADEMREALRAANHDFVANGLTSVHHAGNIAGPELGPLQALRRAGELDVRVCYMVWVALGSDEGLRFLDTGLQTGFGDARLRLGAFKVMTDGSSSAPTCATRQPYSSDPAGEDRGILYWSQAELDAMIDRAHRAGFQCTMHAMGDRAIEAGLTALERAFAATPRPDPRPRIEHCGLCPSDLQARVVGLGVSPVIQPSFLHEFGDGYLVNYGEQRVHSMFPAKSLLNRGVHVCGSSDAPVSNFRPLAGLQSAMLRLTRSGQSCGAEERVSLVQGLRMYTANPAYAEFAEHEKGSLEPGKLADLVVLGDDLERVPAEKLRDVPIDLTLVGGQIVYERGL